MLRDNYDNECFTKVEDDSAESPEMEHDVFGKKEEKIKDAALTDCFSTSVDHNETTELAVAGAAVDEHGKSSNTMAGVENACHGRGVVSGSRKMRTTAKTLRLSPAVALQ